ncbi:MAG TPA: primosomal protein N' [Chitinophagaceae bacterium]|nr:primosomal protein N' [Chitinophagaceae bacterium]
MYAEIIIPLALPKNYTWLVPPALEAQVQPGCRVEVNLGRNKKYAGIVRRLHDEKPAFFEPKEILNLLDPEPVLFEQQLELWDWLSSYYLCSPGEVMAAALPAHFKLSSETILVYNEEYGDDFSLLDHDEYLVAEALLLKKELKLDEVQQILDSAHVYPVINRLIQKRVCHVWEALRERYSPRRETYVQLHPAYLQEEALSALLNEDKKLQRAEKQLELLLAYLHLQRTQGEVTRADLLKKSGAAEAQLRGLVDKGILQLEKRAIDRLPQLPRDIRIDFTLSPSQQQAYDQVLQCLAEKSVCLLHGVTSSGKTQLYIRLIEQELQRGGQVLYLLPEIALTSQIIRRLQKHFGGYIGIYHSRFNQNERVEIWNKVKSGELKIVLGARSAVFLPFGSLRLVICDEEHDTSYKQQEPAPRYQGRDAAIFLASRCGARVVLGSATPSLESYHNATTGKYGLVELTQRYGEVELPVIELVDLRKLPPKERAGTILTPALQAAVQASLDSHHQVILFQNRRGYAPYQICSACGWIPQCRYCDVSLTFHKLSNRLACHYCGNTYPPVLTCPACGSHDFLQRRFGTERIEEHLRDTFPQARIARMDIDTVRGKHAHDQLIQQFEAGRVDILVGTQMVVKGLDFDHVNLVGILDADGLLHFADFRVNERAFQLMEQVSGRAGRKGQTGRVLVQTSQPTHPVLLDVQRHDYRNLFTSELDKRRQFAYPPFTRLIQLVFRHKMQDVAEQAAHQFADTLRSRYNPYLVGPAEPVVARVRNQYLRELLLKLPRDARLLAQCKQDILEQVALLHQAKRFRSVVVVADVDPL